MNLRNDSGAAAVEFAMVLSLMTMLTFGITEFGRALYSKEILTNGTREGARYGIVMATPRHTSGQIATTVENALQIGGLNTAGAQVFTSGGGGCAGSLVLTITGAGGTSGSDLSVRADYALTPLVLPALSGLTSFCLSADTVMKME